MMNVLLMLNKHWLLIIYKLFQKTLLRDNLVIADCGCCTINCIELIQNLLFIGTRQTTGESKPAMDKFKAMEWFNSLYIYVVFTVFVHWLLVNIEIKYF